MAHDLRNGNGEFTGIFRLHQRAGFLQPVERDFVGQLRSGQSATPIPAPSGVTERRERQTSSQPGGPEPCRATRSWRRLVWRMARRSSASAWSGSPGDGKSEIRTRNGAAVQHVIGDIERLHVSVPRPSGVWKRMSRTTRSTCGGPSWAADIARCGRCRESGRPCRCCGWRRRPARWRVRRRVRACSTRPSRNFPRR
jgi:hypothetical protein